MENLMFVGNLISGFFHSPVLQILSALQSLKKLEEGYGKFSLKRGDDPSLKPKMRPTPAALIGPHTLTHQHEHGQTTVAPARRCMPPFGRLHHWQPAGQPACVRLPLLLGLQTAAARA